LFGCVTTVHAIVYSFLRNQTVISHALHTTRPQCDFMEFFDNKDNWGAKSIKVGKINLIVSAYLIFWHNSVWSWVWQ